MSVQAFREATERRRRLLSPPNAVKDRPLEMRNGWPVKPQAFRLMVIEHREPAPPPPVVVKPEFKVTQLRGRPYMVSDIIELVAAAYDVSVMDILSHRRTAKVVMPRQIGMWLAKTMTLRSLPEIGRRFGNRDHTTVLHAVNKIERLRKTDLELELQLQQFMSALRPLHPEPTNAD